MLSKISVIQQYNKLAPNIMAVGAAFLIVGLGIKLYNELQDQNLQSIKQDTMIALDRLQPDNQIREPAGLMNYGNTCYINSVLQCIASSKRLANYLYELGGQIQFNTYSEDKLKASQDIVLSFLKVISDLQNQSETIDPSQLISVLQENSQFFHFNQQQDSHELLSMLLEHVDELQQAQKEFCLKSLHHDDLILGNPLKGRIKSYIYCPHCLHKYDINIESSFVLSLDIRSFGINTLAQALNGHFNQVEVEGYTCTKCSLLRLKQSTDQEIIVKLLRQSTLDFTEVSTELMSRTNLTLPKVKKNVLKVTELSMLPVPSIRIKIGSFVDMYGDTLKLQKHIQFPAIIDATVYESAGSRIYSLTGVIAHYGQEHYGHYINYRRVSNLESTRWFQISDSVVREVNEGQVLESQAYMLFYEMI